MLYIKAENVHNLFLITELYSDVRKIWPMADPPIRHADCQRPSPNDIDTVLVICQAHRVSGCASHQRAASGLNPEGDCMQIVRGKRWDPRPAETIQKILETTEHLVLREGSTEISVRTVCEEADIARGTFYRYFSSKEDLLEGFSCHMREKFERKVGEVLESSVDPSERFAAYLRCVWTYLNTDNARRLFEIEPVFSVKDFRQNFEQSIKRTQYVLDSTFTDWEAASGVTLDRELLSELLIRYMLSELIVPSNGNCQEFLERATKVVTAFWPRR